MAWEFSGLIALLQNQLEAAKAVDTNNDMLKSFQVVLLDEATNNYSITATITTDLGEIRLTIEKQVQ